MSFRGRLTLFFVVIVVVPMIAVALLVVEVSEDSRDGKADSRLSADLETARAIYDEARATVPSELERIAAGERVPPALRAGNSSYLQRRADKQLRRAGAGLASIGFFDVDGEELASAGAGNAIASVRSPVQVSDGEVVGAVEGAALEPGDYLSEVTKLTGSSGAILAGSRTLAASPELDGVALPTGSGGTTIETDAGGRRAASLALEGAPADSRLILVVPEEKGFAASQPLVLAALGALVGLATLLIIALARTLQGQIASMLAAARRIGGGDFSKQVPVEGNDEMAGLAREFNKMSDQLSEQMTQLQRQRQELDRSVRRIGEAFASGLDRAALLEIVVEAAVAACDADAGRVDLQDHDAAEVEVTAAGKEPRQDARAVLRSAGEEALRTGTAREAEQGEARAIAQPMRSAGNGDAILGSMAVVRDGRPFSEGERELLGYLIVQASISVENIGLHERVAEQAITDELTGLPNNRHFREWMSNEAARIGRFGGELSLVLLDIDNFKRVNDTYGHQQGDAVLQEIGRILRIESRGIDEPARYGGEEFVLALPATPKEGAREVAERVRERIEHTPIEGADGNGQISVTASLGVATMPTDGSDTQLLISAADEALYKAKRTGKNRVVAAGEG